MKSVILLMCVTFSVSANFDLRLVARELKKGAPWSLDGSAQDLRSDVKHELQKVMNQFILLLPEAPWTKAQTPSVQNIQQSLQKLAQYAKSEKNADRAQQVKASIDYILNYLSKVELKIAQANQEALSSDLKQLLEQKKELFGQLKTALQEGRGSVG